MSKRRGHTNARSILTATLITAALVLLPFTTLLHHPLSVTPASPSSTIAPLPTSPGAPADDPVTGPVWSGAPAQPSLWAPVVEQPRARSEAFRHPGHLRRIDRPPRA